jgi:hypothetical protein
MTGKQKEQTLVKLYKILNQKNIHTGPTNSAEKSFPNRSEFAEVAIKDLVAQYVKSLSTGTKSTWQTKNIIGLEATGFR